MAVEGVLDPKILGTILRRIEQSEQDVEWLKEKQREIIDLNDQLRAVVYQAWDPEKAKRGGDGGWVPFSPDDPETWPPVLRDQGGILKKLDNLNVGVGLCHDLVIEHRYPELHRKPEPTPPVNHYPGQQASPPPVVIQQQPAQTGGDGSRVRSFAAGFWEHRIARMEIEHEERMEEARRRDLSVTTNRVPEDPIDAMGSRLVAELNVVKKKLNDYFLLWPDYRNRYFAAMVHADFRSRLSRLMGVIESFASSALDLWIKEQSQNLNNQMGHFTRILEAQAGVPVTIQEIHGYRKEGVPMEEAFDGRRRRPLLRER